MDIWKKHILNRGEESTSIAALVCFKLKYSLILWKFSLENNKNFSVEINSKLKNCVWWTKAFLSRPLSNKKVIGSTEVNLGGFLKIKYILWNRNESDFHWTFLFDLRILFAHPTRSLKNYESLWKKSHL